MNYLAISALALGLAIPAMSLAAPTSDAPVSVMVRYNATGLETPRDAANMLRRIDNAAMEACGASSFSLKMYRETVEASTCYQAGVSRAVADLNAPAVTVLYNGRSEARAENETPRQGE